jgi:hypothetical protein
LYSHLHGRPTRLTISAQLPDYYAVLGVHPAASDAELTRAWRQLVLAVRVLQPLAYEHEYKDKDQDENKRKDEDKNIH